MGVNAQNVLVGAPDQATTGAILSAVLGTAVPTSTSDILAEAFTDSGYVNEDGVQLTLDRSTTDIHEWGGVIVRRILDEFNGTIAWAHLETNEGALKNWAGDDNVTVTDATTTSGKEIGVAIGADELPHKTWVFRMKDGLARILIVVPDGQVTAQGDTTFATSGALTWPVTLSCYPDASGKSIYIYTNDGLVADA